MRPLSSGSGGKSPSAARDQTVSPSRRTSKTPPEPGTRATSPRSAGNVVSSSCAIQPARSSQRHCVQNSISTRGAGMALPPLDEVHVDEEGARADHVDASLAPAPAAGEAQRRLPGPAAAEQHDDPRAGDE